MIPFDIVERRSLREAIALLDPEDASIRPIAGGTALMLMMKSGVFRPTRLVSLRAVEKHFSEICVDADGSIRIGALTTLANLEYSRDMQRMLPVIGRTLRVLSNVRIRNVATVGGALAHGDPHMDLPPVLIALGAYVHVLRPGGERIIPVADLLTGYYETQLAKNELISVLVIPPQNGKRSVYLKCTTRAAHDWPALGVSVSIDADRDSVREAIVIVSAATERATRIEEASALLVGQRPSAKLVREASEVVAAAAELTADMQGSVPYKRQLVRVYVERALRQVLDVGEGALQ
jgi:aerobic carbon-monoxide dehydrogenase medium subunit